MALPKIDTPIYDIVLPLSKKTIRFRPFLVKEQKNLMMALEADDRDTIEKNIKQVLNNCAVTEIDIDKLPVVDVEYYFLQLRARSVGEIVDNTYICNNIVDGNECKNKMKVEFNLLDLKIEKNETISDIINLTDKISLKLKYPEFATVEKLSQKDNAVDVAFQIVVDSIEYIFDGEQYYYANESTPEELMQFIESLSQEQFSQIEKFFDNLPRLNKKIEMKCTKCGYEHKIELEGLESFFE